MILRKQLFFLFLLWTHGILFIPVAATAASEKLAKDQAEERKKEEELLN